MFSKNARPESPERKGSASAAPGGARESADPGSVRTAKTAGRENVLSEKRRRELWLYLGASIFTVEMILVVGALLYGIITSPGKGSGSLSFPWLAWGGLAISIPAVILLAVHQADVGLFRKPKNAESEAEWQKHLPERMQRLYKVIKGAPVVVVLLAVVALGAALLTIDGAIHALMVMGSALAPYVPYLVGGVALVLAVGIGAAVWLNYRTRRLYAEYEFRREVLERTGVIIVDKGSMPLPPGGVGEMPYPVLEAGSKPSAQKALESGDIVDAEAKEITE